MDSVYIVGIDPSTSCTGVAIFEMSVPDKDILSVDVFKIVPAEDLRNRYPNTRVSGYSLTSDDKINHSASGVVDILDTYDNIVEVRIESPFFGGGSPGSFAVLTNNIRILEAAIVKSGILNVTRVAPSVPKSMLGISTRQKNSKLLVRGELFKIDEIIDNVPDLMVLVEDIVDAIAIGYSGVGLPVNTDAL